MRKFFTSAVALVLWAGLIALPAAAQTPEWYGHGHRVSFSGDILARILSGGAKSSTDSREGSVCTAESSVSGNVQVNCLAEDGSSPQNTQSETSVSASGDKVVVGFNDSLVCCIPAVNLTGYSVSTDGGKTFTDMGDLPFRSSVQPLGDPAVAHDAAGNFYFASLATSSDGVGSHSLVSFYEMPAGSSTFQLLSVPVDVGDSRRFFADKDYLAVATDASGTTHFYITWTFFSAAVASPIMLTDSTDGLNWHTTMVSGSNACAQGSNPVPLPNSDTVYVSWEQFGCTSSTASETMSTVDLSSHTVVRITTIAPVHGSGDKVVACNSPSDLREVIETAPGHDVRLFELASTAVDANGVLYAVWNDRPGGVGGAFSNATRIFLSYSLDGDQTWSTPQVISGRTSSENMNDRFQPWIAVDSGLHAMWYERVAGPSVDVIRTDKEDLSLASAKSAPRTINPETAISTVTFPVIQTNPNQDPIIANCYMGDYNNITSNGSRRFVTWGDNRNVVTTSTGVTENQPDVFVQSY